MLLSLIVLPDARTTFVSAPAAISKVPVPVVFLTTLELIVTSPAVVSLNVNVPSFLISEVFERPVVAVFNAPSSVISTFV